MNNVPGKCFYLFAVATGLHALVSPSVSILLAGRDETVDRENCSYRTLLQELIADCSDNTRVILVTINLRSLVFSACNVTHFLVDVVESLFLFILFLLRFIAISLTSFLSYTYN